jgi:hypothetical protein
MVSCVCSVTLGTDSFGIPLGRKVPPSLTFLGTPGFLEITAYVLAAAATASISRYRLAGRWPRQTIEALVPPRADSVVLQRRVCVLLATVVLLISCGWEAYKVSLAVPH